MKKTLLQSAAASIMLLAMNTTVNAQWTRNAVTSQTYLTNTGDFLGIGTTNPQYKIDVQSTGIATMSFKSTTNNASLLLDRGSATSTSAVQYRSQGVNIWQAGIVSNSNYKIQNNVLGAPAILIPSANNYIGIGVVPVSKLSNTPNNIIGSDNFGISPNSLTWVNNAQGYGLAVFNSSTTYKANGLAVKCAGNSGRLLDLSVGASQTAPGTSLMVVEGDGNVGIGTNAPQDKLHVKDGNMILDNTNQRFFDAGVAKWDISGGSTNYAISRSGIDYPFVIDYNTSNVGIGTATPAAKLDVAGRTRTVETGVGFEQVDPVNNVSVGTYADADGGHFGTNSNHQLNFYTNFGLPAVTLATSGNFGIGTTTPVRPLEVGLPNTTSYNSIRVNTSYPLQQNGLESTGFEIRIQDAGFTSYRMYSTGSYFRLAYSNDGLATAAVDVFRTDGSTFEPVPDNQTTLGSSSHRWNSVWSANGTIQTSDARYKTNVTNLDYGLSAVMKMRPVSYQWKDGKMQLGTGTNLGFVAQELESVVPDAVVHTINARDKETGAEPVEKESYGVKYAELIPVLTKAIQEQQIQIEEEHLQNEAKDAKIMVLQNQLNEMQQCVESLCNNSSQLKAASYEPQAASTLFQNSPNPFNQTTVIRYALSSDANSGRIIIRDLNGNLVKQLPVTQSGKGQVTINANELAQGTYTYTLEINGESVDTKLMVVTK